MQVFQSEILSGLITQLKYFSRAVTQMHEFETVCSDVNYLLGGGKNTLFLGGCGFTK